MKNQKGEFAYDKQADRSVGDLNGGVGHTGILIWMMLHSLVYASDGISMCQFRTKRWHRCVAEETRVCGECGCSAATDFCTVSFLKLTIAGRRLNAQEII